MMGNRQPASTSEFLANHSLAAKASAAFTGTLFWYPMWVLGFGPSIGADLLLALVLAIFTAYGLASLGAIAFEGFFKREDADEANDNAQEQQSRPVQSAPDERIEPVLAA